MEDRENRTEEATPKRLREAREKGQVAKSADINAAVSFFVFTLLASSLSQYTFNNALNYLGRSLGRNYQTILSRDNVGKILISHSIEFFLFILPFFALVLFLGIGVNLAQVGFLFTTDTLKPNFKKLNPIEGFKNLFSKKSAFTLVKNMAKLIIVIYITYRNLKGSINAIVNSSNLGTRRLFPFFVDFARDIIFNIAIIMLLLAALDFVIERLDHRKNLRMTKQEVKDEFKEMEGSPEVKSARMRRQRELAMSRMMAGIESSTVVVTNPTHLAIAIRYDTDLDKVPVIVAKGQDYLANKIKEKAREEGIPIMENKELARTMYYQVQVGQEVPVELYKAVAEILALVYQMEARKKGRI